LALKTASFVIQ